MRMRRTINLFNDTCPLKLKPASGPILTSPFSTSPIFFFLPIPSTWGHFHIRCWDTVYFTLSLTFSPHHLLTVRLHNVFSFSYVFFLHSALKTD